MSDSFGITYDVVIEAANRLRSENTRLDGIVNQMESTAHSYFANWSALSEGTYVSVSGTWKKQAEVMHTDMEASIQRLLRKVEEYQNADSQSASAI